MILVSLVLFLPLFSLVLLGVGCGKTATKSADGGVFRTGDAAGTWKQLTAVPSAKGVGSLGNANVLTLEMDPADARVIYAGTRETGMFYSEDGGIEWRQARDADLKVGRVDAIAVDPKDGCRVYVAHGPRLFSTSDCLRSVNREAYVETRPGVVVHQVEVDWYDPRVVWLGLSNGDLLKSVDAGNTWRTVLSAKADLTAIAVSRADSRMVLVGTIKEGFFKSIDGGAHWIQIEKELKEFKNAAQVSALMQSADAKVVVAATKYGLIRSKDFGTTWEGLTLLTSPGQVAIKAIGMDAKEPNTLYYAAASTFYASGDAGATWKTHKLPTTRLPETLVVDPSSPHVLYIGVSALPKT